MRIKMKCQDIQSNSNGRLKSLGSFLPVKIHGASDKLVTEVGEGQQKGQKPRKPCEKGEKNEWKGVIC